MACSLERIPIPIFEYVYNNENILAIFMDNLNGRHIIYYTNGNFSENNNFLSYKIINNFEVVSMADSTKDTSALYSPIIKISDLPPPLLKTTKVGNNNKYTSLGLKDLFSLSNLVAYKTIYEEFSLPLFLFPSGNFNSGVPSKEQKIKYVLGTAINLVDTSDNSYFYYVLLDYEIQKYFLKFSTQRSNEPSFSNHFDEHGFIYLKIIKLAQSHPLVKI